MSAKEFFQEMWGTAFVGAKLSHPKGILELSMEDIYETMEMYVQTKKVFCFCGSEIPDSNIEYNNHCNDLGEDYYQGFANCVDCGEDIEWSEWGECENLDEAKYDLKQFISDRIEEHKTTKTIIMAQCRPDNEKKDAILPKELIEIKKVHLEDAEVTIDGVSHEISGRVSKCWIAREDFDRIKDNGYELQTKR